MIMGQTAEVLAHQFSINREEQDEFALHSHQKAVAAADAGRLAEEIVPVYAGEKFDSFTADNGPRRHSRWKRSRNFVRCLIAAMAR